MQTMIRRAALVAGCTLALLLTGCANMQMGAPTANMDNTVKLRAAALASANVGTFTSATSFLDISIPISRQMRHGEFPRHSSHCSDPTPPLDHDIEHRMG